MGPRAYARPPVAPHEAARSVRVRGRRHDGEAAIRAHSPFARQDRARRRRRRREGGDGRSDVKPIRPMLATLSPSIVEGPDWVFEEKYDGIRAITGREHGQIK